MQSKFTTNREAAAASTRNPSPPAGPDGPIYEVSKPRSLCYVALEFFSSCQKGQRALVRAPNRAGQFLSEKVETLK